MKQPMQVLTSQKTVEWYTPPRIIVDAREVLGGTIDCDPASHPIPQTWIRARTYYTEEQNGLIQPWNGTVFLNPPFSATRVWVDKLKQELQSGRTTAAVLLTNSAPGYVWWEETVDAAISVCLIRHRLRFINESGLAQGQAKKGQSIFYFGRNPDRFRDIFSSYGRFLW